MAIKQQISFQHLISRSFRWLLFCGLQDQWSSPTCFTLGNLWGDVHVTRSTWGVKCEQCIQKNTDTAETPKPETWLRLAALNDLCVSCCFFATRSTRSRSRGPGRMQTLLVAIGTGALILGGAMGALVALGASGFFSTTLGKLDWQNVFGRV